MVGGHAHLHPVLGRAELVDAVAVAVAAAGGAGDAVAVAAAASAAVSRGCGGAESGSGGTVGRGSIVVRNLIGYGLGEVGEAVLGVDAGNHLAIGVEQRSFFGHLKTGDRVDGHDLDAQLRYGADEQVVLELVDGPLIADRHADGQIES